MTYEALLQLLQCSGDEAVSELGLRQSVSCVPVARFDQRHPALEVQCAQRTNGWMQQQINAVSGERRAPLPNLRQPGRPAEDVYYVRSRSRRAEWIEASLQHPPAGRPILERSGVKRFYIWGQVDSDDAATAQPVSHDVHRQVVQGRA